jgi:hypothetical protein
MIGAAEKRGHIIRHLEEALALADEIEDGNTGFLIERHSMRRVRISSRRLPIIAPDLLTVDGSEINRRERYRLRRAARGVIILFSRSEYDGA